MSYDNKPIGHIIVRVPITRHLADAEERGGDPRTWFEFEPYELLSEKVDSEYLGSLLGMLGADGLAQTLLNYAEQNGMWDDLKEALEARMRDLKRVGVS
jgi:hypothetical protein